VGGGVTLTTLHCASEESGVADCKLFVLVAIQLLYHHVLLADWFVCVCAQCVRARMRVCVCVCVC
jgi:hypothetical protein